LSIARFLEGSSSALRYASDVGDGGTGEEPREVGAVMVVADVLEDMNECLESSRR